MEAQAAKGYLKGRGMQALPVPSVGSPRMLPGLHRCRPGRGSRPRFPRPRRLLLQLPRRRGEGTGHKGRGWRRRAPAGSSGCSAGSSCRGEAAGSAAAAGEAPSARSPSPGSSAASSGRGAAAPRGADATLPAGWGSCSLGTPVPPPAGAGRQQAGSRQQAGAALSRGRGRCLRAPAPPAVPPQWCSRLTFPSLSSAGARRTHTHTQTPPHPRPAGPAPLRLRSLPGPARPRSFSTPRVPARCFGGACSDSASVTGNGSAARAMPLRG